MNNINRVINIFVVCLFFILNSCWYYSFKGSLPSHVQSVAIPLFNDRTSYPGVRENLTNQVIDEFISDNTLKVVDEDKADLLLTGSINSIAQRAASVSSGEAVTEYKIVVSVKVKCEDIKFSKVLYDKTIQQYGLMPADGGLDDREQAIQDALDLITEDVLNATLGAW